MNRTSRLSYQWLLQSELHGESLLLEALLRRGFLAFQDDDGVWLGTGSHVDDLMVLQMIDGLDSSCARDCEGHRMAGIQLRAGTSDREVAGAILGLPENHDGQGYGGWTSVGVGGHNICNWRHYLAMKWGSKMPVVPYESFAYSHSSDPRANNALDTGIALLVKTFPLARTASSLSCDGHGQAPAYIHWNFPWDHAWFGALYEVLEFLPEQSIWSIDETQLTISTRSGNYDDNEVLGMLHDIQKIARHFLDQQLIDKIGEAKSASLARFADDPVNGPDPAIFQEEAHSQLQRVFHAGR